jgi:hypothetical protein
MSFALDGARGGRRGTQGGIYSLVDGGGGATHLLSVNTPGYPTDGEIWHLAHLQKSHRRGPGKTNPLKAFIACQLLEAKDQLPSSPSLAKMSRVRSAPRATVFASPEPHDIIKDAQPLQHGHRSARAPWHTSAWLEGHVVPSGKIGSHGGPHHGTHSHR